MRKRDPRGYVCNKGFDFTQVWGLLHNIYAADVSLWDTGLKSTGLVVWKGKCRVKDSWIKLNQKQWGKMEFRMYWHLHWSLTVSQTPASLVGCPVGETLVLREFSATCRGWGARGKALKRLTQQVCHELKELWAEVSWCEAGEWGWARTMTSCPRCPSLKTGTHCCLTSTLQISCRMSQ